MRLMKLEQKGMNPEPSADLEAPEETFRNPPPRPAWRTQRGAPQWVLALLQPPEEGQPGGAHSPG